MMKKLRLLSLMFALLVTTSLLVACGGAGIKVDEIKLSSAQSPPRFMVTFTLDKDLDLSDSNNNIQIAYYTVEDGKQVAIKNNADEGSDLVKDKGWAGFLLDDKKTPHVKGTVGADDYAPNNSNILKAGVEYSTLLKDGESSDGTNMNYHDIDWDEDNAFKVIITVITKSGKSSFSETYEYKAVTE